jgi:hypothetical protein
MPELRFLEELLDKITSDNPGAAADVDKCKQLLRRIGKTTVPVHVEINYDGREFRWKVSQNNITAGEYTPRKP